MYPAGAAAWKRTGAQLGTRRTRGPGIVCADHVEFGCLGAPLDLPPADIRSAADGMPPLGNDVDFGRCATLDEEVSTISL